MSELHTATMRLTQIKATKLGWRLFPNVIYAGWVGKTSREWKDSSRGICVELIRARWRSFGLCAGSFDLVGWKPVKITPDMVGMTLAQFVTVDAKTPAYARMSPAQVNYARAVREAGGFAALAQRVGESVAIAEIGEDL